MPKDDGKIVVVIADEAAGRGQVNAQAFNNAGALVYLASPQDTVLVPDWDWPVVLPNEVDLAFAHDGPLWERLGRKAGMVVKYRGGEPATQHGADHFQVRVRAIATRSSAVTQEEATELLAWFLNRRSGEDDGEPALLKRPSPARALSWALMVLCQGFLMAVAGETALAAAPVTDDDAPEMAAAMAVPGGKRIPVEPGSGGSGDIVRSRTWWRAPFDERIPLETGIAAELGDVSLQTRSAVIALVRWIAGGEVRDLAPPAVTAAYLGLRNLFQEDGRAVATSRLFQGRG